MRSRELRQHPVADDAALNFACTFEDRGQARVPPIAFFAPLGRVAVAAVELHGLIGHAHGHLGCEQFHLRGFALGTLALIQKMRDLLPEGACLRNLGRHVRQRKAKYLEPGDRMTELLALLQIGPRVLDGVARAAVEDTWAYLQEREQFGHPIAGFQVLRFALADMACLLYTSPS